MNQALITLEELIQNEVLLNKIRDTFFPLIKNGTIAGYNVYASLDTIQNCLYTIHYLHSDLTRRHRHYRELAAILESAGFLRKVAKVNDRLVNTCETIGREADYVTRPSWKDPYNTRYFTVDGQEVSKRDAKQIGEVIAEGKQYDLIIRVGNENELKEVKKILKQRATAYRIDKFGRILFNAAGEPVTNTDAIYNSWEIPLLVLTAQRNCKPRFLTDFLRVTQFCIAYYINETTSIAVNTLVKSKAEELAQWLTEKKLSFSELKKYALRVFVEDYIDL